MMKVNKLINVFNFNFSSFKSLTRKIMCVFNHRKVFDYSSGSCDSEMNGKEKNIFCKELRTLSRHFIDDVVDSRLRKPWHELVNDLFHEQVRHSRTTALGKLEGSPQVDNIGGISIPIVVVAVLMSIARYLKNAERYQV